MKRDIFNEIKEGFGVLESSRKGKITLRETTFEKKPAIKVTPEELLHLREKLHLSRTVFARYLRTNERTLENWEQGRASPNAQASILIRMVERYPDTVDRLTSIV
ncbi:MAG: transcriptional regulator [Pseudomonadota bacterium]